MSPLGNLPKIGVPVLNPEVSIGVLAHNEEPRISETLRTLFAQDVFKKFSTEVVVVANGCTDNTVTVAKELLHDHRAVWSVRGLARVAELTKAGKANAWNEFVHKLSSSQAAVLVLMDADILLMNSGTISSMVDTLRRDPNAVVCVDRPIKDIALNRNRAFFQHLLLATTPEIDLTNVPLCGQLYCALSRELRLIKLPVEITVEDGFLRALLLTRGFTKPENRQRIILDPQAVHCFASVATLREAFKHEVWVVSGSIINMLLFRRFSAESEPDQDAMSLMQRWQEENPNWLQQYIQLQVQAKGWRLLPISWWTRRWSRLTRLPLGRKLRRAPIALVASAMDMLVFIAAIRDVHRGRAFGYWGRK